MSPPPTSHPIDIPSIQARYSPQGMSITISLRQQGWVVPVGRVSSSEDSNLCFKSIMANPSPPDTCCLLKKFEDMHQTLHTYHFLILNSGQDLQLMQFAMCSRHHFPSPVEHQSWDPNVSHPHCNSGPLPNLHGVIIRHFQFKKTLKPCCVSISTDGHVNNAWLISPPIDQLGHLNRCYSWDCRLEEGMITLFLKGLKFPINIVGPVCMRAPGMGTLLQDMPKSFWPLNPDCTKCPPVSVLFPGCFFPW